MTSAVKRQTDEKRAAQVAEFRRETNSIRDRLAALDGENRLNDRDARMIWTLNRIVDEFAGGRAATLWTFNEVRRAVLAARSVVRAYRAFDQVQTGGAR